ncbi:hypothetical protein HanHA300_Chr12g0448771 [Helianthus annuus]|nr:hypothetical protein HanHA300_Chr12g0448771 [Helianthus annuus]KAJ0505772.1 hypothetical protein HanHA89_Chr12g0474251 [Helianthus annuus]KAJ0675442.1 hypothetical protein HanLR1_Chr12g0451201 [Helianthus annuus]
MFQTMADDDVTSRSNRKCWVCGWRLHMGHIILSKNPKNCELLDGYLINGPKVRKLNCFRSRKGNAL